MPTDIRKPADEQQPELSRNTVQLVWATIALVAGLYFYFAPDRTPSPPDMKPICFGLGHSQEFCERYDALVKAKTIH